MHILSQKLKLLKYELKFWNKNVFGIVHDQVCHENTNLDFKKQRISDHGIPDDLMNLEEQAKVVLG